MNLKYSQQFTIALRRLPPRDKLAVADTVDWFAEDPMSDGLHNHALHGGMSGKRAISVDDDIRIVFIERGDYAEVTLLDVGSHQDVYRG